MKYTLLAIAGVAMITTSGVACADPYVDYTPDKGLWHVQSIHVDTYHIDDYVTGLKTTWVPAEDIAKKHGIIDSYQVMVRLNASTQEPNVILVEHLTSAATLDPDKARDMAIDKEMQAASTKNQADAKRKEYDKYRTFVRDDYYGSLTFIK